MSRRKKQKHDEGNSESWLLPYSDLMTLLLALFIVLFSISSVDAQKFQNISKVFNGLFTSGSGALEYPNPLPKENGKAMNKEQEDKEIDNEEQKVIEQSKLMALQNKINGYIKDNHLENQLNAKLSSEGLLVTINDSVFFNSGSADVRQEDITIAKEISELLVMDPPHNVIISGYTDNVPIQNSSFDSNWELSVSRAVNFMKVILENKNLDPRLFSAKGFGEFQPIASNDTTAGRQKNRRVEVLILPNNTEEE